jgi:hypothetical protein
MPAAATVAFELPNLLAGTRRDYCAAHTTQVCVARGTVLVARFGPTIRSCPVWPTPRLAVGPGAPAGRG